MNIHLKCAIIFAFSLITSLNLLSQVTITDAGFSSEYMPSSHYKMPIGKDKSVKIPATTSLQRYNVNVNLSLSNKLDSLTGKVRIWTASVNGSYSLLNNKGYNSFIFPSRLLSTGIGVQHFRSMKNKWGQTAFVSAGLASDLELIDGNDIFITAGTVFIKRYTPRFALGFGAIVMASKKTFMAFPGLTVQWEAGKKYKFIINSPGKEPGVIYKIGAGYSLNERSDVAFIFRMRMSAYDVETTANERMMNVLEIPMGLDYTLHSGKTAFTIGGGFVPAREYEFKKRGFAQLFKEGVQHRLGANYFLRLAVDWKH